MSKKNRSPINLVEIATSLAKQQALWEPLVSYDPVARYYVRLAREHEFEAWLLTWLPGQGTAWHDHGGSAGAFITLRGVLTERHAEVGDGPPRIVRGDRELVAGHRDLSGGLHLEPRRRLVAGSRDPSSDRRDRRVRRLARTALSRPRAKGNEGSNTAIPATR